MTARFEYSLKARVFGQGVNHGVDQGMLIGAEERLLGAGLMRYRVKRRARFGDRLGRLRGPAPIHGCPPGHSRQERLLGSRVAPSAIAIKLQEDLLHRVFGIVRVEQNRISHAKDKTRLAPHQGRKLRLFVGGEDVSTPVLLALFGPPIGVIEARTGIPRSFNVQQGCSNAKTERGGGVFGYLRGSD